MFFLFEPFNAKTHSNGDAKELENRSRALLSPRLLCVPAPERPPRPPLCTRRMRAPFAHYLTKSPISKPPYVPSGRVTGMVLRDPRRAPVWLQQYDLDILSRALRLVDRPIMLDGQMMSIRGTTEHTMHFITYVVPTNRKRPYCLIEAQMTVHTPLYHI